MTHHLKIHPEYYEAVLAGTKRFEVRKDDRTSRYAVGDTLILEEFADCAYTGRVVTVLVDYIYRGAFCLDGYCIMSIRSLRESAEKEAGTPINFCKDLNALVVKLLLLTQVDENIRQNNLYAAALIEAQSDELRRLLDSGIQVNEKLLLPKGNRPFVEQVQRDPMLTSICSWLHDEEEAKRNE